MSCFDLLKVLGTGGECLDVDIMMILDYLVCIHYKVSSIIAVFLTFRRHRKGAMVFRPFRRCCH